MTARQKTARLIAAIVNDMDLLAWGTIPEGVTRRDVEGTLLVNMNALHRIAVDGTVGSSLSLPTKGDVIAAINLETTA